MTFSREASGVERGLATVQVVGTAAGVGAEIPAVRGAIRGAAPLLRAAEAEASNVVRMRAVVRMSADEAGGAGGAGRTQAEIMNEVFRGGGVRGSGSAADRAREVLAEVNAGTFPVPAGLTVRILRWYREIAVRALERYSASGGSGVGEATQRARIEVVDALIRSGRVPE